MGWYNRSVLPELNLGDIILLRKLHPCGGNEWLARTGATYKNHLTKGHK